MPRGFDARSKSTTELGGAAPRRGRRDSLPTICHRRRKSRRADASPENVGARRQRRYPACAIDHRRLARITPVAILAAGVIALAAPSFGGAQAAVPPGTSPPLHGYAFKPYRNAWALHIDRGTRHADVGTWTDELKATPIHGRPAFTRTQALKARRSGNTQTWVNVFDPVTLRPYSSALVDSDGHATLRLFTAGTVTVTDATDIAGYPVVTRKPQAAAYDFDGGMYGLLFLGLPLRPGLEGTLATYGTADASIEHLRYRVRSREVMRGGARSFDTYVVECSYLDAHRPEGDARMTFWLAQTPPYIIKLLYDVPSRKELWTYTML